GENSQIAQILVEHRNKKLYATAVISLELSAHCASDKKNLYQKQTSLISFLQKHKIGHAIANTSIGFEESIEDMIERILLVSPDIIIFHDLNPISLSIAERIEGPKKLLLTKAVEKGIKLPFDKIIARFGKEEGNVRILMPPPLHHLGKNLIGNVINKDEQPLNFNFLASTFISEPRLTCHKYFGPFLNEVLKKCPNLHLAIFGSPPRKELIHFFDSEQWEKRVHFPKNKKEQDELLNLTHIYLNPFPIGSQEEALPFLMNGQPIFQLEPEKIWHTRQISAQSLGQKETIFSSTKQYMQKIQEVYENPRKLFQIAKKSLLKSFIIHEPAWYTLQFDIEIQKLLSFN
ncbi:hypothetical protein, partial [Candidatus Similichlamydia epinepheli]|uniref:hypothetical protein n=1 Tax=Candidatus Similichlamydia epinepheli TaxID=1903953 RepID=UPI00130064C1